MQGDLTRALAAWQIHHPRRVVRLSDRGDLGNQSWSVWTHDRRHLVARRSSSLATRSAVAWEHLLLRHLAGLGWSIPAPVADPAGVDGTVWSLFGYVRGAPCELSPRANRARGRLLASLHAALLPLRRRIGERPDWEPAEITFADAAPVGLRTLPSRESALAAAIEAETAAAEAAQQEVGVDRLPRFTLHGDFTAINVLQRRGLPAAVIDFDLCHIGTRPWEFAIARLYKAPEMLEGYRDEAARLGIGLTDEELRAIPTVYRVFRAGMIRWQLIDHGLTGRPLDLPFIRRQLDLLRAPHPPAR